MAELVVGDILWKKGETGIQTVNIYDSDNITRKDITGITYTFKFWKVGEVSNKGTAVLTPVTPLSGIATFTVSSGFTDTVEDYLGELVGDDGEKSNTFDVKVIESAPA